jgi:hypothetical protein
MTRINSVKAIVIASLVLLHAASLFGADQPVPSAPIPAQIAAAKKIFIANVPGAKLPESLTNPTHVYDEFYAAMKTWGHYDLASTPADADLIFEVNFVSTVTRVSGTKESGCDSSSSAELQLVIVDPKTRIILWWLQDDIEGAIRAKTWDKNLDTAMSVLVGKVQILSTPPTTTTVVGSGKP